MDHKRQGRLPLLLFPPPCEGDLGAGDSALRGLVPAPLGPRNPFALLETSGAGGEGDAWRLLSIDALARRQGKTGFT